MGFPLAIFTLVLYYHRLTMHKIPAREVISSVFLPLGPLGEGGFGIMKMGQVSLRVFPATNTLILSAGQVIYVFGFLTALLMWGFGLAWLFWALASFGRSKSQFNMGWWSIVFATGVFTGSTIALGQEMTSRFFNVLGTVSLVCRVLIDWNSKANSYVRCLLSLLFCFGLLYQHSLSAERFLGIYFSRRVSRSLRLHRSLLQTLRFRLRLRLRLPKPSW
jgi:hypothetical protein